MAERLNVSLDSLIALGAGFNRSEDCWTFPERKADGSVRGINRRLHSGEKRMMKGHRRGLYFANTWMDGISPVLIVEGASDTAAAITLGLSAIGRPSAIVPHDVLPELVEILKNVPVDRPIIVVGENDEKPNGSWPGRDGAARTARALSKQLRRPIEWALPPSSAKDLRTWLKSNDGRPGREFVDALVIGETEENATEQSGKLIFHDAWKAAFQPRPMRDCIIEGMLRRGEVANFIATTKTGKSWFALMLLICIATGRDWLGRVCQRRTDNDRRQL